MGFSLVVVRGLLSSYGVWAPERMGSVVAACGLSWPMACGISVPRPGIEPTSPALEGGFSTTGPPGKSLHLFLSVSFSSVKYMFNTFAHLSVGLFVFFLLIYGSSLYIPEINPLCGKNLILVSDLTFYFHYGVW